MTTNKIFVYGTLKKKQRLHRILAGSLFVGEGHVKNYRLYNTGFGFPAVLPGQGVVYGELYIVGGETLRKLDLLESAYNRIPETVVMDEDERTLQAYLYVYKHRNPELRVIESGIW